MNVVSIDSWRIDGCTNDCAPRQHDPSAHEAHGRILEREAAVGRIVGIGPLVIDLESHRVLVHENDVVLTPNEWKILAFMARNVGRLVTHDEILARVWGAGYAYRHIVRVNMARLRHRLGSAGYLIETVFGQGFRLTDKRGWTKPPLPLPARTPKPKRWARNWDACQWCHGKARPHASHGLCTRCEARKRQAGKFI